MRYEEKPPPPPLAPFVECLWRFSSDAGDAAIIAHVIPPDGAVSISAALLGGAPANVTVTRPSLTALRVDIPRGAVFAGARLRPGLAPTLLRCDVERLAPAPVSGRSIMATSSAHDRFIQDAAAP